jgi:5-hydroxyisourate hydrolase
MSVITTHILDTVLGKPAAGVAVRLEKRIGDSPMGWNEVSAGVTDADGRCRNLAPNAEAGTYRLVFDTSDYFNRMGRRSMYPEVVITFMCGNEAHYHLPLLLSDNSYTTYRGS